MVVARLDYRISSSRTKSVELRIYGGAVGGGYFVRRFCSLPRLAFLCSFRSAGFTRGGASPGQDKVSEMKCSLDGEMEERPLPTAGRLKRAAMRY